MSVIEKGAHRYRIFKNEHAKKFGAPIKGRLLDFGCGAGGFVIAALRDGVDVYGIEVDETRLRQCNKNSDEYEPRAKKRFTRYPGRLMPYPTNHFDACYSWFVFEHVTDPQTSLREIVRVLRPGGTLCIHAEDVRNAWDGHAQAPWPPYLPREFAAAYLEGLGLPQHAEFVSQSVVYVSAPLVADILSTLGMEVTEFIPAQTPKSLHEGVYVTNDAEARALGSAVRNRAPFTSPAENMGIWARKPLDHGKH
ncbi:class I SAM-dependent methyltransferase [Pseudaminobacter sp. 19-2017]|uniref:Class I SAM-dependent methyltransferase n=1 Tax=Pseudaminobacter soli (ex Zhang et al. 2022) TaxID=2831468 RepID=A0A942DXA1_9HYPH|nr:class I SAM-dependent methyltransferase [Pseudaminobacter soli]